MKKYTSPEVEIITVESTDVITASSGTETGKYDETDGIWDLSLSLEL